MTYATLPPRVREIAERVLTEKQLEAFRLEQDGLGLRLIARHLDIAKPSVEARIDAAHRKLRRESVRQDGSGNWYLEREEAA